MKERKIIVKITLKFYYCDCCCDHKYIIENEKQKMRERERKRDEHTKESNCLIFSNKLFR